MWRRHLRALVADYHAPPPPLSIRFVFSYYSSIDFNFAKAQLEERQMLTATI